MKYEKGQTEKDKNKLWKALIEAIKTKANVNIPKHKIHKTLTENKLMSQ